jgi:hypothetical protein
VVKQPIARIRQFYPSGASQWRNETFTAIGRRANNAGEINLRWPGKDWSPLKKSATTVRKWGVPWVVYSVGFELLSPANRFVGI